MTPTATIHRPRRRTGGALALAAILTGTSVLTLGAVAVPVAAAAAPTAMPAGPAAPAAAPSALAGPRIAPSARASTFVRGRTASPRAVDRAASARNVRPAPIPDPAAAAGTWGAQSASKATIAPGLAARVTTSGRGTGSVVFRGPGGVMIEGDFVITGPDSWEIETTGVSGVIGGLTLRDKDISGRLRVGTGGVVRSSIVIRLADHEKLVPAWEQTAKVRLRFAPGAGLVAEVVLRASRGENNVHLAGPLADDGSYRASGDGSVVFAGRTIDLTGDYVSDSDARGSWLIAGTGDGGSLVDGTRVMSTLILLTDLVPGVTGSVALDHGIDSAAQMSLDLSFVDGANWSLRNPTTSASSWTPESLPRTRVDLSQLSGAIVSVNDVMDYSVAAPTSINVDRLDIGALWQLKGPKQWVVRAKSAAGEILNPSLGLNAVSVSGRVTASATGLSGTFDVRGSGELVGRFPSSFSQSTKLSISFTRGSTDESVKISRHLTHVLDHGRSHIKFRADVATDEPFRLQAVGKLAVGKGRIPVNGSYESEGYTGNHGTRENPFWKITADIDFAHNGRVPLGAGTSMVGGMIKASSRTMGAQPAASEISAATDVPEFPPGFEGDIEFKLSDNDPFTKTGHLVYQDEDNWSLTTTIVDGAAWTPAALPGLTIERNGITGSAYSVDGKVSFNITIPSVTWRSSSTGIVLTTPMSLSNECPLEENCPGTEGIYVGFVGGTLDFPGDIPDMQTTGAFLADGSWARLDATLDDYTFGPVTLTDITLSIWRGVRSDEPVPELGMPDLSGSNDGLNIQFCGGFEVEIPDIDTVGTDGCVAWSEAGIVIGQLALGGSVDSAPSNGVDIGFTTINGFAWTDLPTMPTIDLDGVKLALEAGLNNITADLQMPGDLMRALGQPAVDTVISATGWFDDGDFSLDADVPINMTNNGFTLESVTVHIGKEGHTFTLELGANAKVRAKGNQYPVSAFIGVEAGGGSNGIVVRLTAKGAVSAQPDGTFDQPQLLPEGNFEPADDAVIDGSFDSRSKSALAHGDFENATTPVNSVPNGDFETGVGQTIFPQGDFEDGKYGSTLANGDLEDTNMLVNGDFEDNNTGSWTTTSNWTATTVSGTAPSEDEGYYVAQLGNSKGTASSTTFGFTQYLTFNPVLTNATYTLTLWAKSPDTTTGVIEARIVQDQTASGCSSQSPISAQQVVTVGTDWTPITVTAAGASCRSRVGVALTVTTAGDSVLVDDVELSVTKGTATSAPTVLNTYRPTVSSSAVTQKVLYDPANAKEGNQYLSARSTSSNWSFYWMAGDAPVQYTTYTFSAWVKAPSGSVTGKLILGTSGGTYEEVKISFTANSTWQRVVGTLKMNNASHTDMVMKLGDQSDQHRPLDRRRRGAVRRLVAVAGHDRCAQRGDGLRPRRRARWHQLHGGDQQELERRRRLPGHRRCAEGGHAVHAHRLVPQPQLGHGRPLDPRYQRHELG